MRIARAGLKHELAAAHDDDDRARNAPAFEGIGQIAVHPRFEILGIEGRGRRLCLCGRNGRFGRLCGGRRNRPLRRERQRGKRRQRSEEHTSELQSLMRTSYAVFCWKKKKYQKLTTPIDYN